MNFLRNSEENLKSKRKILPSKGIGKNDKLCYSQCTHKTGEESG